MKVLHLAPPASTSDRLTAHSFIDEEIRGLADAGVRCTVLAGSGASPGPRDGIRVVTPARQTRARSLRRALRFAVLNAHRLPAAAFRNPRTLVYALRTEEAAAAFVRDKRIDVIHSHFGWPAGFGGALAAAIARVPLVASLRGMDLLVRDDIGYGLQRDPAYRSALGVLLRRADRTIYATEFLRSEGLTAGAAAARAVVVRKGVDVIRFQPPADRRSEQQALGLDGPVILGVGTLGPRKGYEHLLAALGGLRHRPWSLVLCGEGPHRAALEAQAAGLNIGGRVHFAGWVPRTAIGRYFSAADVFVHPAVLEAAGNVILESLASGCATVAADSGGPAEYLVDGETGLVVPPEDAGALGRALAQVLQDGELRTRLGAAGRRAAEERYRYSRMIGDLVGVYSVVASTLRERRGTWPRRGGQAPLDPATARELPYGSPGRSVAGS